MHDAHRQSDRSEHCQFHTISEDDFYRNKTAGGQNDSSKTDFQMVSLIEFPVDLHEALSRRTKGARHTRLYSPIPIIVNNFSPVNKTNEGRGHLNRYRVTLCIKFRIFLHIIYTNSSLYLLAIYTHFSDSRRSQLFATLRVLRIAGQ